MTCYRNRTWSAIIVLSTTVLLTIGQMACSGSEVVTGSRNADPARQPAIVVPAEPQSEGPQTIRSSVRSTARVQDEAVGAQRRVATLASREFAGRGYLYDGHNRAADFIADEFRDIGVEAIGQSYFRSFEIQADLFPSTPSLSINNTELQIGIDFIPFPGSASGSGQDLEIIDLSYGLHFPDEASDFDADVTNKWILVRKGVPDSLAGDQSGVGSNEYKALVAAANGVAGMVVVSDNLVYGLSQADAPIPVFEVLSASLPYDASTISFELESTPNAVVETRNVIAYLPASIESPTDSLILVVAHYDHQGAIGEDAFFPGANDNASGIAAMLDVAQYFVDQPRASDLLFVAFSGEEVGLLGSKAFIRSPPVDLSRISLVVNLDMVASAEDGVVVMGGVENVAEFEELSEIASAMDRANAKESAHRIRARSTTAISDHYPFFAAGIKSLYLYTNKGTQPYHSIRDVPDTLEWDDYVFVRDLIIRFLETKLAVDDR